MDDYNPYQDLQRLLSRRETARTPVVLWYTRSSLGLQGGARRLLDYYQNPEIKHETQLFPLKRFPEALVFPGIYPDYGVALEASAFGSPVRFFEDNPPQALPFLRDLREAADLRPIDPQRDGLMPQALKEYSYMLAHLDRTYVKRFPYLDGCAWVMGPLEVADFIVGPERLFVGFYDFPQVVHRLLTRVTEGLIAWLKALQGVCGELKLICMVEHTPGQISASHSEEFFVPYAREVFRSFPKAIRLYHNEDDLRHAMRLLPRLGAQIWHCGPWDLREMKATVGKEMALMGNIHPLKTLLQGTPREVEEACRTSLEAGAPGGGFLLSSGGGLAPETPLANVEAMIRTAASFSRRS